MRKRWMVRGLCCLLGLGLLESNGYAFMGIGRKKLADKTIDEILSQDDKRLEKDLLELKEMDSEEREALEPIVAPLLKAVEMASPRSEEGARRKRNGIRVVVALGPVAERAALPVLARIAEKEFGDRSAASALLTMGRPASRYLLEQLRVDPDRSELGRILERCGDEDAVREWQQLKRVADAKKQGELEKQRQAAEQAAEQKRQVEERQRLAREKQWEAAADREIRGAVSQLRKKFPDVRGISTAQLRRNILAEWVDSRGNHLLEDVKIEGRVLKLYVPTQGPNSDSIISANMKNFADTAEMFTAWCACAGETRVVGDLNYIGSGDMTVFKFNVDPNTKRGRVLSQGSREEDAAENEAAQRKIDPRKVIAGLRKQYASVVKLSKAGLRKRLLSDWVDSRGNPLLEDVKVEGKVLKLYVPPNGADGIVRNNTKNFADTAEMFDAWCSCDGETQVVVDMNFAGAGDRPILGFKVSGKTGRGYVDKQY